MSTIAIIPARGGSKRIPRKNIKYFLGKPIIAYSIEAALLSELFDEVMVSTDDDKIAAIARQYGAKVPFLRSPEKADDHATLSDVLMEVIETYQDKDVFFNNVCCILPTAPLTSSEKIKEAFKKFANGHYDSLCPVVAFSYPILRALEFSGDNKLQMIWPEYLTTRSQDLKPAYHDSGTFYWIKTDALKDEKTLFCKNGSAIEIPENEVQDIDTETDWKLAEIKFQLING